MLVVCNNATTKNLATKRCGTLDSSRLRKCETLNCVEQIMLVIMMPMIHIRKIATPSA